MSSRKTTCRFASASVSSTEVLVSRRKEPADHAAVGRCDRVLDEVPLDTPAGVEDVDHELLARDCGHAREIGPDLPPLTAVAVTLGALLLIDDLAVHGVAPLLEQWSKLVEHLLPVRIRQPTSALEQLAGAGGDLSVGMSGQRLFLVERQLGDPGLVVLEGVHEGGAPISAAEHDPQHPRAHAGTQPGQGADQGRAHLGRLAQGDRVDQSGGQLGRAAGRDQFQKLPSRGGVLGPELDKLPGRVDPA